MVRINSIFRFSPKTTGNSHVLGLYLGVKFGEDRWKIAICRAFNSCDRPTH